MSTTSNYTASPLSSAGVSLASSSTAWLYSSYGTILSANSNITYITAVTFMPNVTTASLSLDTTAEVLIELYKGVSDTLIAQIPLSYRIDTRADHVLPRVIILPEPLVVEENVQIRCRVTDSIAAAMTHSSVKIFYYYVAVTAPTTVPGSILMMGVGI